MSSLSDWYNAPKSDRGANQTVSKPSSSSGSSSSSSSTKKKTPTPTSGGYMNTPIAGGSAPPMPSSYQVGDVTYTPGPTNWDSMSQSQRDAYGRGISGGSTSSNGGAYPPMPQQSSGGIWAPVGQNQKITAGMGMGLTPPPMPAQSMEEKNRAEAKARLDKQRAGLASAVDLTKTGLKNTYDYTNLIQKDQRVLEDQTFLRNSNPYGGSQGYLAADMARNRSIADTAANKDYTANTAAADKRLADFDALAPEQQDAMYNELQRIERQFQMDEGALTGNYKGGRTIAGQQLDSSNQFQEAGLTGRYNGQDTMQQRQNYFNNGIAQAGLTGYTPDGYRTLAGQGLDLGQSNADRAFNAGRQDAATAGTGIYNPSGLSYDQVSREMADNSAAWHKASPEQQTQLNERNRYLGSLIGKQYDPGTGEYSQGNSYVGTKTPQQQQLEFNQNLAANELKFKQDSYKQTFDENVRQFDTSTAIERAYKAGQLTLEQARTAISQQQANTASSRNNWDMSPSNPDNLLKKLQVDQFGRPKAITPEDVISQLNKSTFVELDENTKRPIVYDSQGLAKSILSLNMAAKDTDYLFSYYNIDKNKLLQQLSGN